MKINKIILSLVGLSVLFACEKETTLGPDIESIGAVPVPVSTFSSSKDTVDFVEAEQIFFNLEFEQPTNWLITLTGLNSGAEYTFEDVSGVIDESNSNWMGETSGVFFQAEDVVATVSFPNYLEEPTLSDTFTISNSIISNIERVLYSDFEVAPIYNFGNAEPAGGGWGSDFHITVNTNTAYPLYDENAYIYFEGEPWQANSPYVDLLQLPSNLGDTLSGTALPLFSNPERVYINLAVYNTGAEYTWFRVELKESSETGPGRYVDIRPDWEGWKLISIKYSDLLSEDPSTYDPTNVVLTNLLLFSDQDENATEKETVSIAIDQLIFSFDSPLGTVSF